MICLCKFIRKFAQTNLVHLFVMINRVLIRIKVVQMLYSYMLTRSEFKIDEAPDTVSRDRRYAYSAYITLLLLLLELSGYSVKNGERNVPFVVNKYLNGNNVAKALSTTDTLRSAILRGNNGIELLDPVLEDLMRKITQSEIYKSYSNTTKKKELSEDVTFWITVFETIIAKDRSVIEAMRNDPSFTNQGFQTAIINLCSTLRSYNDSRQLLSKAHRDLQQSLDKAYELYLGMLKLILDLTREMEIRQENAKNKYIVTSEDLNPNTRFVDNALAEYLRDSDEFNDLVKEYKVDIISSNSNFIKNLLDKIVASDIYKNYLEEPATDFVKDVDFWREVMKNIILPSDELAEELEDKSVYWNDDMQIMGTFVLKTIRQISAANGKKVSILPKYKDDEDRVFGEDLFRSAVDNAAKYREYIDRFIDNSHWDPDRMAFMDIIIMITAIAEIIKYPAIPIPVSINEYVEIANNYSTDRSGAFVNGILFSVTNYLKEQGIIFKT